MVARALDRMQCLLGQMCLHFAVIVRPGYISMHACTSCGVVLENAGRWALYAFDFVCLYHLCVALARVLCYIAQAWTLFFIIVWCCCHIVVCANTCQCCLLVWCVINGVLSVSHENQYPGVQIPKRLMTY